MIDLWGKIHSCCARLIIDKMTVLAESLHLASEVVLVSNGCSNSQVKSFPYRNNPCISLQSHVFWQLDVTNTDVTGFNFVPNSITKQTCRLIWQQNMVHVQYRFSLCAMSSKPIGAKSTNIWFWCYIHTNMTEQSVYICSPEELMLKHKSCTSLVDTVTNRVSLSWCIWHAFGGMSCSICVHFKCIATVSHLRSVF